MSKRPFWTSIRAALGLGPVAPEQIAGTEMQVEHALEEWMALPPDTLIARSREVAAFQTGVMKRLFKIGSNGRWDADLEAGTITFTNEGLVTTAAVQVIGTLNTEDSTWLWGWDHPSVLPSIAETAKLMLDYGNRHGLERLTTRKITCTEEEAWELTSMASALSGAQGLYRGPAGSTLVYMTFGTVSLMKER